MLTTRNQPSPLLHDQLVLHIIITPTVRQLLRHLLPVRQSAALRRSLRSNTENSANSSVDSRSPSHRQKTNELKMFPICNWITVLFWIRRNYFLQLTRRHMTTFLVLDFNLKEDLQIVQTISVISSNLSNNNAFMFNLFSVQLTCTSVTKFNFSTYFLQRL